MKFLVSLFLLGLFYSANANTYYFSSVSGDDSRSSIQAQNSSTPWKSINKLNAIFTSLQPGDQVLLKRGETFIGTITMTKSGSGSMPIIISAYGSGSKPVITSLVTLSSWTANSGYAGVYESYVNGISSSQVNILLMNGSQKAIGRFPNSTASNKGYLTLESHSGNTSIYDKDLSSSPNWKGGDIVLRTNRWMIDRSTITGHSGGTITYNSIPSPARDGYGYFIQNHIQTLDVSGEWYYNKSTKKMNVYFGGSPSSYKIQVATLDNLVSSKYVSYIKIDNLEFTGANQESIYIYGGTGNSITNCDISFSGTDGVYASGLNFKLENSTIDFSNNDGVDVSNGTSATVRNCTIKNSYTIPGMGLGGNGQGAGVRNCSGGVVEYNQIINTGYVGVELGGDNAIVRYNLIDHFGYIKDDCGGIYTSNGNNKTSSGRKIIGNVIIDGMGAPEGTNAPGSSSADGIYLDDNVNGIEITDNTAANCNKGIYVHNSRNLVIKGNTFYNCRSGQIYMKHDNLGDPLRNLNIQNNIFFSKEIEQLTSSFITKTNDFSSMGTLNNNYYARPIDDKTTIYSSYLNSSGQRVNTLHDLKGWSSLYPFDNSSKTSSKKIVTYFISNVIGSNKFPTGKFGSSSDVAKVWPNSTTLSWASSAGLDGGCLKAVPTATGSSIVISVGSLSSSKKYVLRYSVKGTGTLSMGAYLRSSDYNPLTPVKYWSVSTSRKEHEMLFQPEKNESNGAIVFKIDVKQTYYIDNIEVYEANGSQTNPDDSLKFVYNASKSSKSFSLNGDYIDVKSNKYSKSITLKPYSSAVLIHNGSVSSTSNLSPVVALTSPDANKNYGSPASVKITASASDPDGSISKVEFYHGATLIQTKNTAPYDWTWGNLSDGSYTITAKAFDNSGNSTTSSPVTFTVGNKTIAPPSNGISVSITSPKSGGSYSNSVRLTASATDANGSISKVKFYNGNTLITTENKAPYDWTWQNVAPGSYTIVAKATDNEGNVTTSSPVSFSVGGAPSVSITSPKVNSSYSAPASVRLTAAASDPGGSISKVDFYNGNSLITTERIYPYDWTWNNVPSGNYTLVAKATDNDGNVTTSSSVAFTVGSGLSVSIVSPSVNQTYNAPASIKLKAEAAVSNGSIERVEFYNGNSLINTQKYYPYSWSWDNVAPGTYNIKAKAYDNLGNSVYSSIVSVVVGFTGAPYVMLTSPTVYNSYSSPASVQLTAKASDPGGSISKVEFYNGTKLILTEYTAPYSKTWSNVPAGSYTITAKAYDNSGKTTVSPGVSITVSGSGGLTTSRGIGDIPEVDINQQNSQLTPGEFSQFKIYPNPATNYMNLAVGTEFNMGENLVLTIMNISGATVKQINQSANSISRIDISYLAPGAYILKVSGKSKTVARKFIKTQ